MDAVKLKKKLIEVALPLPEINDASAYDKMPGIGPHPKGIHHWWARLPLPTARAVLFASVVDDPEAHPEIWPTEEAQKIERERLFDIMRRMMGKKLHEAPEMYAAAKAEMLRYCDGHFLRYLIHLQAVVQFRWKQIDWGSKRMQGISILWQFFSTSAI